MKLVKRLTLARMEAADITDTSRSTCTMVCTSPANGVVLLHSSNLKRCFEDRKGCVSKSIRAGVAKLRGDRRASD